MRPSLWLQGWSFVLKPRIQIFSSLFLCRAERDERNLDREIRNEQEQAFQETLRRDQEREQRIAEEDLRRQEEAAEEERKRQEEERVRKAELDRYFNGQFP